MPKYSNKTVTFAIQIIERLDNQGSDNHRLTVDCKKVLNKLDQCTTVKYPYYACHTKQECTVEIQQFY